MSQGLVCLKPALCPYRSLSPTPSIDFGGMQSKGGSSNWQRQGSDSKDLPSVRRLGKGLSGFLYETTWEGNKYVRKDFPLGSVHHNIFEKEAMALLDLEHPNIVRCPHYTVGKSSCSLLLEYVDDDLQNIIQKRIEAEGKGNRTGSSTTTLHSRVLDIDETRNLMSSKAKGREISGADVGLMKMPENEPTALFEMPEAVDILSQIATGMEYLHDNGIVHGDLKPKNVLVGYDGIVKLVDFGLLEIKKRIKLVSKRTRHFEILMWKAPERFAKLLGPVTEDSDDPFTDSDTDSDEEIESSGVFRNSRLAMADVYSFGLICSQILVGKLMYSNLSLTQLREQRMHGFRPELPSTCPKDLRFLIFSSVERDPWRRPTITDICAALKAFQSNQRPRRMEVEGKKEVLLDERGVIHLSHHLESSSGVEGKKARSMSMDVLPDELLRRVLRKLLFEDLLRAGAVCKRWKYNLEWVLPFSSPPESRTTYSLCPLIFKSDFAGHITWCGYNSTHDTWEKLPSWDSASHMGIYPLAGNGKTLMGFNVTTSLSAIVVGNPLTSDWQTIPGSDAWGDVGYFLLVDKMESTFRIIAVHEIHTEIFKSQLGAWTLRQGNPVEVNDMTVNHIRSRNINVVECWDLLYFYAGNSVISFDVRGEKWTGDHITIPPHSSPKCFQLLECAGNIFVAIDDTVESTITVWGLGLRHRESFFPCADMPQPFYALLTSKRRLQLRAVGHKYRMFFFTQGSRIVVFDLLRRTWAVLPEFKFFSDEKSDRDDYTRLFTHMGSFEP